MSPAPLAVATATNLTDVGRAARATASLRGEPALAPATTAVRGGAVEKSTAPSASSTAGHPRNYHRRPREIRPPRARIRRPGHQI